MLLSWHMVKQAQEKPLQWRDSSIIPWIHKEVSYQDPLRRSSNTSRIAPTKVKHNSLFERVIYKSIMKLSVTLFVLTEITYISEKTKNEECSLMDCQNGQSGIQVRFLVSFREVRNSEGQLLQR